MLTTLFKFLLMFLFERLKTPNNKTPDIKKKKQKSYRWEVVCICHSAVAPVCTQASCRQRCGRDRRTHRPNVIHEQQTRESERKAIKSWRLPVQVLLPKRNTGKTPNVLASSRLLRTLAAWPHFAAKHLSEYGTFWLHQPAELLPSAQLSGWCFKAGG